MPNPFEQAVAEQRAIADAMTPQTRRRPTRRQRARVAMDVGDIVTTPSDAIVEERVTDAAPVAAVPVAVAEERPAEPAEVGHDEAIVRAPESPVAAAQAEPEHDDDVVVQTAAQRPAVAPTTEEHRAETEPVAAVAEPPDDLDAPIVGGKPQAAAADVVEPDDRIVRLQDDRARLEEARRRGRRRDIAMGVTGGVLALGGGLMAGLGALSGNEGLMAAGGSLGTIGGAMPMGARRRLVGDVERDIAFRDQQEGIARQIAKEQADEVARGRQLGLAERNADNYERNTLENQRASQARASLASAQASRESELFRRQYDPETEQAVQARNRLLAAINRYASVVPGASTDDYQDVYRQAGYIGALEIEPSIEDVERQITSGVRRRGGGGGNGHGGNAGVDIDALRRALIDHGRDPAVVNGLPRDAVVAEARELDRQNGSGGDGQEVNPDMRRFSAAYRPVFLARGQLAGLSRFLGGLSPMQMRAALTNSELGGLAGQQVRDARQRIGQIVNAYYHDVSGAAVSDGEAARYQQALGTGQAIDPGAFTRWINRRIEELDAEKDGITSDYGAAGPEFRNQWETTFRAQREARRRARAGGVP